MIDKLLLGNLKASVVSWVNGWLRCGYDPRGRANECKYLLYRHQVNHDTVSYCGVRTMYVTVGRLYPQSHLKLESGYFETLTH